MVNLIYSFFIFLELIFICRYQEVLDLGLILTIILATAIGPVDISDVTVLKRIFHLSFFH